MASRENLNFKDFFLRAANDQQIPNNFIEVKCKFIIHRLEEAEIRIICSHVLIKMLFNLTSKLFKRQMSLANKFR